MEIIELYNSWSFRYPKTKKKKKRKKKQQTTHIHSLLAQNKTKQNKTKQNKTTSSTSAYK